MMARPVRAGSFVQLSALIVLATTSGCSIYKAATLPAHRNLGVLSAGTPRLHVIAELGIPASTQIEDGCKRDLFVFRQGPPPAVKSGRVVLHTAADVLTVGLWEIAGTPIEFLAEGKEMSLEVSYDENDRVKAIVPLASRISQPPAPMPFAPDSAVGEWTGTATVESGPTLNEPVTPNEPATPPPSADRDDPVSGASQAR